MMKYNCFKSPKFILCLRFGMLCTMLLSCVRLHQEYTNCKAGNHRDLDVQGRDLTQKLPQDTNYPHVREWIMEHIYYSYWDGSHVYTNQESTPGMTARKAQQLEQKMFDGLVKEAVQYLNAKYAEDVSANNCQSIRYRTIATIGVEAQVTCNIAARSKLEKVNLISPMSSASVTSHQSLSISSQRDKANLNIIIPLKGRVETLQVFLTNLIAATAGHAPLSVALTVVYFEDAHAAAIRDLLVRYTQLHRHLFVEYLQVEKTVRFSRALAVHIGYAQTRPLADVVFVCDVDIAFDRHFLHRCMSTPVLGKQIYFPILFSRFNPENVPAKLRPKVSDHSGYWRIWGHGMVCAHRLDLIKLEAFQNHKETGWGSEDIEFLTSVVKNPNYKVIRGLDPGIFHRYHQKDCSVASSHRAACEKVKGLNEGSREVLGSWYVKYMEKSSECQIQVQDCQSFETEQCAEQLILKSFSFSLQVPYYTMLYGTLIAFTIIDVIMFYIVIRR